MTEYRVMKQTEREDWEFVGQREAVSAKAAIQGVLNGPSTEFERHGTFVAVPARSWQPVTVKVETALKFS